MGFRFHADPGDSSTSAPGRFFAEIRHERNGLFAREDGDDAPAPAPHAGGASRDLAFATPVLPREYAALSPTSPGVVLGGADVALRAYLADPGPGAAPLRAVK
jgi:hypothetical protein